MLVQAVLSWDGARVAGEFLAAGPGSEGRWLEIADVIAGGRAAGCGHGAGTGAPWLRAILARYPGCAVAATGQAGGCVVVARGTADRSGICGRYSCGALAGGALAHCWLTADWPHAALRQARFIPAVAAQRLHCSWQVWGQAGGSPFSLVVSVQPAGSALSLSSWRRTGSASGAPSSS